MVCECGFLPCLLEVEEISPKYWLTLGWNFPPGPLWEGILDSEKKVEPHKAHFWKDH